MTINEAIKRQNKKMRVISQKQTFTETSKESLKRRIQSLEEENNKLKNDSNQYRGTADINDK